MRKSPPLSFWSDLIQAWLEDVGTEIEWIKKFPSVGRNADGGGCNWHPDACVNIAFIYRNTQMVIRLFQLAKYFEIKKFTKTYKNSSALHNRCERCPSYGSDGDMGICKCDSSKICVEQQQILYFNEVDIADPSFDPRKFLQSTLDFMNNNSIPEGPDSEI